MSDPNEVDLLIGVYGFTDAADLRMARFISTLRDKCGLRSVNVFCVERECRPAIGGLRNIAGQAGFAWSNCPLPPLDNGREDTSRFCNWMVDNIGRAPWFCISHFDIEFKSDYIARVQSAMPNNDMIGNHHDGIVFVRRSAYRECGVGFCGIDNARLVEAGTDIRALPDYCPDASNGQVLLSLDVGEVLALRMCTLRLRHAWLTHKHGTGKGSMFLHERAGSGYQDCK